MNAERAKRNLEVEKNLAHKEMRAASAAVEENKTKVNILTSETEKLIEATVQLELENEDLSKQVASLEAAAPIMVIDKEYNKQINPKGGQKSWPIYIWKIILEQLVNNTPPTSIASNIVSVVKAFSPGTKIENLPSVNAIRRGQTTLGLLFTC